MFGTVFLPGETSTLGHTSCSRAARGHLRAEPEVHGNAVGLDCSRGAAACSPFVIFLSRFCPVVFTLPALPGHRTNSLQSVGRSASGRLTLCYLRSTDNRSLDSSKRCRLYL